MKYTKNLSILSLYIATNRIDAGKNYELLVGEWRMTNFRTTLLWWLRIMYIIG